MYTYNIYCVYHNKENFSNARWLSKVVNCLSRAGLTVSPTQQVLVKQSWCIVAGTKIAGLQGLPGQCNGSLSSQWTRSISAEGRTGCSIWATLFAERAQWITSTSVNSCPVLSAWHCYHCLPFYKVFCFDFMFAFAPEFNILLMCPENQYGNALIYHQQLFFYQLMGSWLCVSSPEQQNAKFWDHPIIFF